MGDVQVDADRLVAHATSRLRGQTTDAGVCVVAYPHVVNDPFGQSLLPQRGEEEPARGRQVSRFAESLGRGKVYLSQILEWYESEFIGWLVARGVQNPTLLDYVARYVDDETAAKLRRGKSLYIVEFTPYDWRLNDRGLPR